jgi:type IV pilus assembly protein PilY1
MDLRGANPEDPAQRGEQTISAALIAGGMVTFSTNRPKAPDPNTCAPNLGEARGYWLNLFNASGAISVTGGGTCGGIYRSTAFPAYVALPPTPVLATVTVDGKVVTVVIGAIDRGGGASAPIQAQRIVAPVSLTRRAVYWHNSGDN